MMGTNGNNILKIKYNQKTMYEKLIKMYDSILSKNL